MKTNKLVETLRSCVCVCVCVLDRLYSCTHDLCFFSPPPSTGGQNVIMTLVSGGFSAPSVDAHAYMVILSVLSLYSAIVGPA